MSNDTSTRLTRDQAPKMPQHHNSDGRERSRFTSSLIAAIEELETRRQARSPQQLADAAWHKLQFDLPLVETAELEALLQAFSASFVGKAGWPCYLLTHKALDNISSGARGAASYAPPQLTEQEQEVQQMLSASLANKILGKTSSSSSSSSSSGTAAQQQHEQQQPAVSQQQLYQQLAAVLLLQYAAKVASLPEQEAWQLMQAYCPDAAAAEPLHQQPPQQSQQPHPEQHEYPADDDAVAAAAAAVVAAAGNGTDVATDNSSSSCSMYEDTEAAQQDADTDEYEPLEVSLPAPRNHQHQQQQQPSVAQWGQQLHPYPQQQQQPHGEPEQQPFSWPALHHKLLSLSEHVHYSLLSHEPLWRQQQAAQHLLQLLRLLGVHSHAQELQPLLHAYVSLFVDRLAAAPQDLPLLHQLWEALGLTGGSAAAAATKPQAAQQQQGLYPEAVLGLSVAAAVWQQLPGVSARRQLWQLMHDDLLPLLESCAEQLAYSSSGSQTSSKAAAAGGSSKGAAFAHVLLLSHILELLVLGRPAHVDAAKQLTERGVTRSLVQLHLQWGCEAAAEPLRRALLLACCSSPSTAAWVLAVPGVKQQLQQQPAFQPEAALESHGALWQLLLHPRGATTAASSGAGRGAGEDQAAEQQLLALLRLPSSNLQQLQRQVVLLQLLADAQRATGGSRQQRLWSDQVLAALRKLAAQLKEQMEGAGSSGSGQRNNTAKKGSTGCSSDSDGDDVEHVDCCPVQQPAAPTPQQQLPDTQQLEHRRSAQLRPTTLRLVKELLTQGGGKTD